MVAHHRAQSVANDNMFDSSHPCIWPHLFSTRQVVQGIITCGISVSMAMTPALSGTRSGLYNWH